MWVPLPDEKMREMAPFVEHCLEEFAWNSVGIPRNSMEFQGGYMEFRGNPGCETLGF